MQTLTKESFERPDDLTDRKKPDVLYALTLLTTRAVIGFIGIALPLALIIGERFYLQGGVQARGSISAYYHTGMRDLFVASLCVIGFFLVTYMLGQTNTQDFWFSLIAGVAVIGVAFFPTTRPGLDVASPRCGVTPVPEECAAMQQLLGETTSAWIHFVLAAIFILCLARICFLFARREQIHLNADKMALTLRILGWTIVAALAWIGLGRWLNVNPFGLTALYVGEIVSVWAFGIAWLLKARDLRKAFPANT